MALNLRNYLYHKHSIYLFQYCPRSRSCTLLFHSCYWSKLNGCNFHTYHALAHLTALYSWVQICTLTSKYKCTGTLLSTNLYCYKWVQMKLYSRSTDLYSKENKILLLLLIWLQICLFWILKILYSYEKNLYSQWEILKFTAPSASDDHSNAFTYAS